MSLEVWPHLSPTELENALESTLKRELEWQLVELGETLTSLQQSLHDCYNLLGPSGGGNTLVVSTPRNELLKGHITRLGTRIVKGTIHVRLRTLPAITLQINPDQPITIAPLNTLHTLLTRSIDLLTLTLTYSHPQLITSSDAPNLPPFQGKTDVFIATQLRVLAQALSDASALLKGPPLAEADPSWSTQSVALSHFSPSLPPNISFYIGLQDSQLVLWLRALEPVGVPLNLGMMVALALGTARRLEHDESDQIFTYCSEDGKAKGLYVSHPPTAPVLETNHERPEPESSEEGPVEVYVREKVRVESADPNLLSLSAKLSALGHTLMLTRRNLAAVMGEEFED